MIYNSEEFCTVDELGYTGLFDHTKAGATETLVIKDPLINNDLIGGKRASAELLKGGYTERWITLKSTHNEGLKQNDIITYAGFNWIIKEITLSFKAPKLIQTIKGVRYE